MSDRDVFAIDYLYGGDDTEVKYRKVKRLKVRYRQVYCSLYHDRKVQPIPAGQECVRETALVEGRWSTAYTCIPCIDKAFKEQGE